MMLRVRPPTVNRRLPKQAAHIADQALLPVAQGLAAPAVRVPHHQRRHPQCRQKAVEGVADRPLR